MLPLDVLEDDNTFTWIYNFEEEDIEDDQEENTEYPWTVTKFILSPLNFLIYFLDILMEGRIKKIIAKHSNLKYTRNNK